VAHFIVLDEDMWPRLANELRGRGKQAIALKNTELAGTDDPDLIATIGSWTDTILLTRDDNMPSEHEGAIASVQLTIAVVAPRASDEFTELSWEREIVHRWAHQIEVQEPTSIFRYTLNGRNAWRPRKRPPRARRVRQRRVRAGVRPGLRRKGRPTDETLALPFPSE
jgi:hypothetical protein